MADEFDKAVRRVDSFKSRPPDETLLHLYGLYKQVTVGDINTEMPGIFDMKGRAKWNAWKSYSGLDKTTARTYYINLVNQMVKAGW